MHLNAKNLVSVVIPLYNESENILPLSAEIIAAFENKITHYEIIFINDHSSDETLAILEKLSHANAKVRHISHKNNYGQSIAVMTGVKAAKSEWIATLDGDGQNDPNDIPRLFNIALQQTQQDKLLIAGHRIKRKDTWSKRVSTKIANNIRKKLLRDDCPDTGCGLKIFKQQFFLSLPHFNHMHRFLPALTRRAGGHVINIPVNHRPRTRGQSKYGMWDRLKVGVIDLFGVMWLIRRSCYAETLPSTPTIAVTEEATA